ncbi:MAG: hypothetical protein IBX57_01035 [Gammaproteobacteria bacterium]|nr:hypothetical protein [Gammaproteobacteria bacterium]
MSSLKKFNRSPLIRPLLNVGCLFDIPTGVYLKGKHGENILNAGLPHITGIVGRGNTFKSTIAHFMNLRSLDRHRAAEDIIYDTEVSLSLARLRQLSTNMTFLPFEDFEDEDSRIVLTDKTQELGSAWFEKYKEVMRDRAKDKTTIKTTPFINKDGEYVKGIYPFLGELDSFSQMSIEAVETLLDKGQIGDSKLNTEALKEGAAKSQLMVQLPGLTGMGGGYLVMTAHVGDEHQLDPYAPPSKKLAFLKGKSKIKRVPENFTFLTNNLWYCANATVLINQANKTPEYPRGPEDDLKGDTDLMIVTIQNLRAKTGPTGIPFELVISQSEGVHVGLSEFNYIKNHGRYGLGGHDRSYYLELVPDISLQRTTVRSKIDESPKLRRALEIASEMCQIKNLWHHFPKELLCSPKELYDDLVKKGYDWELLLDTRGYWMFEEDITKEDKPFLSTLDLMEMRVGKYHPYWYPTSKDKMKKLEDK